MGEYPKRQILNLRANLWSSGASPGMNPGKSVFVFVVWSFLLFGLFGCYFFLLFGRGRVFFCCLGRGRFFFYCLGGGREFTHLPVCLARL